MDFSAFSDKLVIRRTTLEANPTIFSKFDVDTRFLPLMFLVNNTAGSGTLKQYEKFNEATLKRYMLADSKSSGTDTHTNVSFENVDADDDDHLDEVLKSTTDLRKKFAKMIRVFMKHANLVPHDELNQLHTAMNAAKEHDKEVKKQDVKAYLKE
jgi:hypothetical protein